MQPALPFDIKLLSEVLPLSPELEPVTPVIQSELALALVTRTVDARRSSAGIIPALIVNLSNLNSGFFIDHPESVAHNGLIRTQAPNVRRETAHVHVEYAVIQFKSRHRQVFALIPLLVSVPVLPSESILKVLNFQTLCSGRVLRLAGSLELLLGLAQSTL